MYHLPQHEHTQEKLETINISIYSPRHHLHPLFHPIKKHRRNATTDPAVQAASSREHDIHPRPASAPSTPSASASGAATIDGRGQAERRARVASRAGQQNRSRGEPDAANGREGIRCFRSRDNAAAARHADEEVPVDPAHRSQRHRGEHAGAGRLAATASAHSQRQR